MKDEIMEICKNCKYHYIEDISFDYPQSCCNITNPNHTTEAWLHCDNFEYSKDYIINLQNKLNQYEDPDDLTLFYMWLDEKAKDKIKELQEENRELNKMCEIYSKSLYNADLTKAEKRIKKATKKVKDLYSYADNEEYVDNYCKDLLNILQGEDNE